MPKYWYLTLQILSDSLSNTASYRKDSPIAPPPLYQILNPPRVLQWHAIKFFIVPFINKLLWLTHYLNFFMSRWMKKRTVLAMFSIHENVFTKLTSVTRKKIWPMDQKRAGIHREDKQQKLLTLKVNRCRCLTLYVLQRQTAVAAYFSNKQLLLLALCVHNSHSKKLQLSSLHIISTSTNQHYISHIHKHLHNKSAWLHIPSHHLT